MVALFIDLKVLPLFGTVFALIRMFALFVTKLTFILFLPNLRAALAAPFFVLLAMRFPVGMYFYLMRSLRHCAVS